MFHKTTIGPVEECDKILVYIKVNDISLTSNIEMCVFFRTDEIPRSPGKHSTTRLPPAGKSNSLVVNGDIHHRRPPQPNRNYINHGKSNGTVTQQNNRRNVNDNRHISSLTTQKNNGKKF